MDGSEFFKEKESWLLSDHDGYNLYLSIIDASICQYHIAELELELHYDGIG